MNSCCNWSEVGAPNDYGAAFVGCFDGVIPVFEIYESSPFLFRRVGKFGVAIEVQFMNSMTAFFDEKVY